MTVWKKPTSKDLGPSRPALFLDRDGVVIADENYLADPAQVRILPGVPQAMAEARKAGFLLIGVSNQSGIGRGYFRDEDFQSVMQCLDRDLQEHGAEFDSFHYCPHHPEEECTCRKPRPGMLEEAAGFFDLDLPSSWMVGDKASDILFGLQAGMHAVLVRTGYGKEQEAKIADQYGEDPRVLIADDLVTAVRAILATRQTP
jgi:D,D-heptose 1,7-bisphosphate phosphatase